jgi:hypothetical protein
MTFVASDMAMGTSTSSVNLIVRSSPWLPQLRDCTYLATLVLRLLQVGVKGCSASLGLVGQIRAPKGR